MWRTRVKWAILTNGKEWRLYGQAGDLVEAAHLSIPDLPGLIESDDQEQLRYFLAFFGAAAFRPDASGDCFLDRAFAESEANARRIGDSLRDQMFAAVPKPQSLGSAIGSTLRSMTTGPSTSTTSMSTESWCRPQGPVSG